MIIEKIAESVGLLANVFGIKTNSDKDTYSCNYINEKFAILEGSIQGNGLGSITEYIDYPPGYTADNCVRIAFEMVTNSLGYYSSGSDFEANSYVKKLTLGSQIIIDIRGISLNEGQPPSSNILKENMFYKYKIVLMKID